MNAYLKEVHEVAGNKQNSLSPPNFELWKKSLDKVEKTLLLRLLSCIQLSLSLDSPSVVFYNKCII